MANAAQRKLMRKQLERDNARRPKKLTPIPRENWPAHQSRRELKEVWISNRYLVQVFDEGNDIERLSVNRTEIDGEGKWRDNLSWDELQAIKAEVGRGDREAVEVYPRDVDIVNVANMRHLWVLPYDAHSELGIGWRRNK